MKLLIHQGEAGQGMADYRLRPVDGFKARKMEYDFTIDQGEGAEPIEGEAGDFLVRHPDGTLIVMDAEAFGEKFARVLERKPAAAPAKAAAAPAGEAE